MSAISMEQLLCDAVEYAKSFENNGEVASYIPELSNADRNALGVAVVANNKKIYKYGNWDTLFTIQSTHLKHPVSTMILKLYTGMLLL